MNTNASWPFVTITNSAELFEPYRNIAGAAALQLMPFVTPRLRDEWEQYAEENQGWIAEDLAKQNVQANTGGKISSYIRNYVGVDTTPGQWVVWWQYAPVLEDLYFVNFNRLAWDGFVYEVEAIERKQAVISAVWTFKPSLDTQSTQAATFMDELLSAGGNGNYEPGEPIGYISYPVFDSFVDDIKKPVGVLTATVYWRSFFENVLHETAFGVYCVVSNSLGQVFTYRVQGREAKFLGMEDLHDRAYNKYEITVQYQDLLNKQTTGYTGSDLYSGYASYSIKVYPTAELEEEYITQRPFLFAAIMFFFYLFTVGIFSLYDCVVEKRQKIVLNTAIKTTAVVDSLFPENIRARLIEEAGMGNPDNKTLSTLNVDASVESKRASSKPIADFFSNTTIMFADLVGFTAWASAREPSQVFVLLETVYQSFDEIAKKRNVFKVETVGDCYVAAAGIPKPRSDHAVVMARFATDCLRRLSNVTAQLEVELGPGTSELNMRFGLHSGAVTAGVLRGDRSRFQLFGDTVNTASRMESTGVKGRVQVSEETAALLRQAGKGTWLKARDETVIAKGKGEFKTYFVNIKAVAAASSTSNSEESEASSATEEIRNEMFFMEKGTRFDAQLDRLVRWNAEVLGKILKQIIARRMSSEDKNSTSKQSMTMMSQSSSLATPEAPQGLPLDEVQEVIVLPKFDRQSAVKEVNPDTITLDPEVESQIFDLVRMIAFTYNKNPFHNFKHATHVAMSVTKLLSRIVAPQDVDYSGLTTKDQVAGTLHDHTYGITSDPLTHFACVFAALVHDADHPGVPNSQLIKENTNEARVYKGRSIAEQNSLCLTWEILMDNRYAKLRRTMCETRDDYQRFRQLTVNLVMATDIMDKDLKALRNGRWDKAFAQEQSTDALNIHRKATIVIEHLIQASDVAHTMQHWHVYRHHNECLFFEMAKAFDEGRSEKNPADFWYEGEIGFFDFYIIPLAKKLKDCGVFGVSSDEVLTYATRNRKEWQERGQEVVAELIEKYRIMKETPGDDDDDDSPPRS